MPIKYEPSLEEFEFLFKKSIKDPLLKIQAFEEIFGICIRNLKFK